MKRKKKKRGETEFLLNLPILGIICWEVEGSTSKKRKLGKGEKFLLFFAESPKKRKASKQAINNMPKFILNQNNGPPAPPVETLQISFPASPTATATSKPLVQISGWLSCPKSQDFRPG